MKKLKLYKRNKSQKSKLSEIVDVVKNADRRACSLLTLLSYRAIKKNMFTFQKTLQKLLVCVLETRKNYSNLFFVVCI